ncbi:MAG: transposase [Oscillospiraceae bacterium]|nr:transposase [Oscillospiraceae bacterium]
MRPPPAALAAGGGCAYRRHALKRAGRSLCAHRSTYALRQQSWLMHVFCDGRLELSNNRAERSVRPFAIGRKNCLFSNTPLGAKISAVIYSLVETAKTNGLNPASYLEYLLNALPRGSLPGDCLPWLPAVRAICKA